VISGLNPYTTCTMYISLTIFLFRSGIAFYFRASEVVQDFLTPVHGAYLFIVYNSYYSVKKLSVIMPSIICFHLILLTTV
jgi:hypothetical protein